MSSDPQRSNQSPDPSSDSTMIHVTLLLDGGHQHSLALPSDAPLLKRLFTIIAGQSAQPAQPTSQLIQIPIQSGKAVLSFRSDRLVGLVTEPPLIVQPAPSPQSDQPDAATQQAGLTEHAANLAPAGNSPHLDPRQLSSPAHRSANSSSRTDAVLTSQCIQVDQFLTPRQHQALIDFTLNSRDAFVSSSTSTGEADYRKSFVLHTFPDFAELVRQRIHALFPDVIAKLDLPPFAIAQIESQLTAHNHGHYYRVHNDNGSADTATRELTYVYYFYREPKPFSGGELRVYDSKVENNYYVKAASFQDIEPRNNSIVFFLSRYMHEVLPIACPTRDFADSRFTINGWIRR
ncbi:MAG TPA: 2OG-Fe(II) oxygenase [Elainellaceae cyanobacterium]